MTRLWQTPIWQTAVFVIGGLIFTRAGAEVITPVDVLGTSEFGAVDVFGDGNLSDVFVTDLIDGGGLMDIEETPEFVLDDWHDNDASSTNGWHAGDFSAGLPGGIDGDDDPLTPPRVDQQALEFDLGGLFQLTHAHVWQQNQGPLFGTPPAEVRGVDEFRMLVNRNVEGAEFQEVGIFQLVGELGEGPVAAQVLPLDMPLEARRVRFEILSATGNEPNEFVGLSEVRFEGSPVARRPGDFDLDGDLDADDIDQLSRAVRTADASLQFDVDQDGAVSASDRTVWVTELKKTWFGDANLDGLFDSADFVATFTAGEYEDEVAANSGWARGDWNGDAEFDSADFVTAFTDGGYEAGLRPAIAVPEPGCTATQWLTAAIVVAVLLRRRVDTVTFTLTVF